MFVVQTNSDENLNLHIYDSPFPMGSGPERSQLNSLNWFATLKGTDAYINFLSMQTEKENVATEAYTALLYHVWEMIPSNPDERETMRDNLKEMFHSWLDEGGRDTSNEFWPQYTSLYRYFDRFLELCKNIDRKEFNQFLKEINQ